MRPVRLAFSGASGTGKSTLAIYVAELLGLPINPIGSRSVAQAMGFENPYDVDRAGKRTEFQQRLLDEKLAWERDHEAFVTDRTTLDNLAYTTLHNVHSIDAATLTQATQGAARYTHVAYCPVRVFFETKNDPARVSEITYHHLYDTLLEGLIRRYLTPWNQSVITMNDRTLIERKRWLRLRLGLEDV